MQVSGPSVYPSSPGTSTGAARILPIEERYWPLHFEGVAGSVGCTAYPINYEEVYNLKGRLLTLVDAMFADPAQRKAFKDLVWNTLRDWMENVEHAADGFRPPDDSSTGSDPE
jgi:hypothetical protein